MDNLVFKLKTLTPICTGGIDKNDKKLHLTGIKGSLRWWYEVLIRGLGAYACDPHKNGCNCEVPKTKKEIFKGNSDEFEKYIKSSMCPACYLFGCTGWSSKFILKIIDPGTNKPIKVLDQRDINFDLFFQERKPLNEFEETLINMMMNLIVHYGALGAKTGFKPSEIKSKNNKFHHLDFGIITFRKYADLHQRKADSSAIEEYLDSKNWISGGNDSSLPDLKSFWFIQRKHINRMELNKIVNRNAIGKYDLNVTPKDVFMGGFIAKDKRTLPNIFKEDIKEINASSKKIFSFHGPVTGNDPVERVYGYVSRTADLDAFLGKIIFNCKHINRNDIKTMNDILAIL